MSAVSSQTVGFGGSCHWCTEAIFLSLKGIVSVRQGWISPAGALLDFSEAVLIVFNPDGIPLRTLIEIHLRTHSSTGTHAMREKYRSAVYCVNDEQEKEARVTIEQLQPAFQKPLRTTVTPLGDFRENNERYRNYYFKDPDKPFCRNYIDPKLRLLLSRFSDAVDPRRLHTSLRSGGESK